MHAEPLAVAPTTLRHRYSVVDAYGRVWGWQWRENFGSAASFPIRSVMGQVIECGVAGLGGRFEQHTPEVFRGQGLEFATALKHTAARHRTTAWLHYVPELVAKEKAVLLDIHEQTYWQRVRSMRVALADSLAL